MPGETVEVEIAAGVRMVFCWVPSGEARLGAPAAELAAARLNYLSPEVLSTQAEEKRGTFKTEGIWLAKYPVTQHEFQAVMGRNPSRFQPSERTIAAARIGDTGRFPVEQVSEIDCALFLDRLVDRAKVPESMGEGTFVLPTENEWEYACRGGRGNRQPFYFGDALNGDKANCDGTSPFGTDVAGFGLGRTTAVGSYESVAPHPWGLCDMCGNVYQLCDSRFEFFGSHSPRNTQVIRGGAWFSTSGAAACRSAHREGASAGGSSLIGFRVGFRMKSWP